MRIITILMDLSVPAIYATALKGLKGNLYIYILLFTWLVIGGIILFIVMTLGGLVIMTTLASSEPGPGYGTHALIILSVMIGIISLVMTLLSAGARAGILSMAAQLRKGERVGPINFFKGILRFTWRLFIGGIVIGMLTAIPALAFLLVVRYSFSPGFEEIFTSGWNYQRSFDTMRYFYNAFLIAGAFQTLVFFWIALWDEMVVFYDISFSEALVRSFTFVFSGRHFARVLGVIIANLVIANLVIILTNPVQFADGLNTGFWYAWLSVMVIAPSSSVTPWVQLLFLPVYAFAQLFLLPIPEKEPSSEPDLIAVSAFSEYREPG